MKQVSIGPGERLAAVDRVARPARRAHPKLALVRPVVAPVEAPMPERATERPSFESAALTVMLECQRFTFYR